MSARPPADAHPEMHEALGPHGIPLIQHARVGGDEAREVLELLEASEVRR